MSTKLLIWTVVLTCLGVVGAQTVDPNSIPIATRDQWCNSQTTACPLLCLQLPNITSETTNSNTCDPTTLSYTCICSNNQSPNSSEYSQTLPYYLCTYQNNQCVSNCTQGDSTCQSACRTDNPCGAQSPTRINTSTKSTMSATAATSSTAAGTAVYTGFGGASSTASPGQTSGAFTLMGLGDAYELGVMAVGFFAGFALLF